MAQNYKIRNMLKKFNFYSDKINKINFFFIYTPKHYNKPLHTKK